MPEGEEQIRTAEGAIGADLEELVRWIDDGAIAVGYDGSQPYGGMVLVPNDVAAAERRLGQLATFAGLGALDPTSGDHGRRGGRRRRDGDDDQLGGSECGSGDDGCRSPTSVVVEYAVTDDRALIGIGDVFVRRVLALDEADSLAAEPRYADAIAELGGSENAGVAWLDLAGTREAIESALGPSLEAADAASYETEIRPWLLPLDRLVSVTRVDGDVLIQRAALLFE